VTSSFRLLVAFTCSWRKPHFVSLWSCKPLRIDKAQGSLTYVIEQHPPHLN
jgi:hypothetical protein